jgi:branched-subunit amino acid aminotransferase/4-amino-4-deoxychorismate lyase
MDRLRRDCQALFGADLDTERVRELARRAAPSAGPTTIRVTIFDPNFDMGHPGAGAEPHILVTSRPAAHVPLPPLRVQAVKYTRDLPRVKSVGLFATLLHRRSAQLNGFDDALFVDDQSVISEGGTWNVGFFDGERVIWPDAECLVGVTMELLKRAHEHEEATLRLPEVQDIQAVFATNAAIGVRVISGIDETSYPESHAILDTLRKQYTEIPGDVL